MLICSSKIQKKELLVSEHLIGGPWKVTTQAITSRVIWVVHKLANVKVKTIATSSFALSLLF